MDLSGTDGRAPFLCVWAALFGAAKSEALVIVQRSVWYYRTAFLASTI